MPTFNAADIIGKTLVAKKSTNIYRLPNDAAESVYVVSPGQSIGVVDSYFLPSTKRNYLYWGFVDNKQQPYYVEHKTGQFDVNTLKDSGVLTLQEKQEQAEAANETTKDKIFRYSKNGFLLAAAVYLVKSIIDKKIK